MSAGRHHNHKQIYESPPVGYYKPKFTIVDRKSCYNIKLSEPKRHTSAIPKIPLQISRDSPEVGSAIKGPLQFEKQLDRYHHHQKQHLDVRWCISKLE
jgi:hypothetical protein